MVINLIDGQFYWLKNKQGALTIGRYHNFFVSYPDGDSEYHTWFDVCGSELIYVPEEFDVIAEIPQP